MTHIKPEWIEFANKAARKFEENPSFTTVTIGEIEAGCLFAVKWGLGDDCVLVFQLDNIYEPAIFTQIIKEKK